MKKLLLIGYRGFGDWLFAVPLLKYLFEEYDVHIEMNDRGFDLFADDERFADKTLFKNDDLMIQSYFNPNLIPMKIVTERKEAVIKAIKPDRVIDLFHTLESNCVAEKWQQMFYEDKDSRRKTFGDKCWYKPAFDAAGIEMPGNLDLTGLYFTQEQIDIVERWREHNFGKFVVIVPVKGSGFHKRFLQMDKVINEILDRYDNSVIYVVGDNGNSFNIKHERVYSSFGHAPFKQMALMIKYADMVIGPETGLQVAAGMWGTPKIQLCNMSNIKQLCQHHKNDYSIQSACDCSPCHKLVHNHFDCDNVIINNYGVHAACTMFYDVDEIMRRVDTVYSKSRKVEYAYS